MRAHLRANVLLVLMTMLPCCVAYPLVLLGLGQAAVPGRANGSLLTKADGRVMGSRLIAQSFTQERYFWPRPSAIDYNAAASGGSNLGAHNPKLRERAASQIARLRAAHPDQTGPIPADLVTTSGSGLDPHISRAAAEYQAARVATARGLPLDKVRQLIDAHTEGRTIGAWGEPLVNVVRLNLALESAETP